MACMPQVDIDFKIVEVKNTNLGKTNKEIIYELLLSMNNGNCFTYDVRLLYAYKQYLQLIERGIIIESEYEVDGN
jgi:hypothetical protein